MNTRSIRRLAVLGAVLGTGAVAAPALGHAPVVSTSPAEGATVSPVRTVSVRFAEGVVTGTISVAHGGGAVRAKSAGLDPRNPARLRASFPRRLSPGRYAVTWRARSDDGHSARGTFRFRVR